MRRAATGAAIAALAAATVAVAGTQFSPGPHGHPPLLQHAGGRPKPVRLLAFVPRSYRDRAALAAFPDAIAQSRWWAAVSKAYDIPSKILVEGAEVVTDMPPLTSKSKASDYQDWIAKKLTQQHLTSPDPAYQTIYILYIPCGGKESLDRAGCTPHHPPITPEASEPQFTGLDAIVAVTGDPSTSTNDKTVQTSHELAEAATNSGPGGWKLQTAHRSTPWVDSSPFVEHGGTGTIEAADMSSGDRWYERFGAGRVYEYQRIYSNASSRQDGDPAVPANPHPYFNVYARGSTNGWYRTSPGAVGTIALDGWSTAKTGDWDVTAKVASKSNPTCAVAPSSWTHVNNRTPLHLSLVTSPGSPSRTWCVVSFTSVPEHPFEDGDDWHMWFVGFVIKS